MAYRKTALCAGINRYPDPNNRLGGCVNDATDWAELLSSQGYDVKVLVDAAATRNQILYELGRMANESRRGDRIVFTFSGHGSWIPDTSGVEVDGRDEVLCAYDFRSGGLVTDDALAGTLGPAKAGVLILSDSCHSGTVSRLASTVGTPVSRGTAKFIPPHTFLPNLTQNRAVEIERTTGASPRTTTSLISGCADPEYSYDATFGNRPNGAFTRVAIDAFRDGISLNRWFKAIRETLPSAEYPQSPQLTAASTYRKYSRAI